MGIAEDEVAVCLRVLRAVVADRGVMAGWGEVERREILELAAAVVSPDRVERRRLAKAFRRKDRVEERAADLRVLAETGMRRQRMAAVFETPRPALWAPKTAAGLESDEPGRSSRPALGDGVSGGGADRAAEGGAAEAAEAVPRESLARARTCYICKAEFREVHFFYDSMCSACGDFNWAKRNQSVRLDGRVALITGARVKIGYQASIKLLRAGARVVVTTRFPRDAAARYAKEPDYAEWGGRLSIFGLDLRHTPSVERFARQLGEQLDRLDFIINNACQTVRRPAGYYAHLVDLQTPEALVGPEPSSAALSQVALLPEDLLGAGEGIFPAGALDKDLQQVDLRLMNSWRLTAAEVPTIELLEVQLVNAVAPFVLNARLKPLMLRDKSFDKHIVNVSAMEGQFYRSFKTDKHPHTNMAKAALNMLTRTSAQDYARDGIYMNSVDTGWVTDEDPLVIAEKKAEEQGFTPPLDIVDGAARILAPIFDGLITGKHAYGLFYKDYRAVEW